MVETFDSWVRELGQLGYLVLALAALIEYLAPPFPGDTIVLIGGAYAVRGHNSVFWVWVAVTMASVVGIGANYAVGRFVADRTRLTPGKKLLFGITHQSVMELQDKMRQKGAWLLVANRFLPSFRSVLFIAAGASHMPLRKVLFLGVASAMAWNGLLLGAGVLVGGNAERLEALVRDYKIVAGVVLGLVILFFVVRWALHKKGPRQVHSP
jgi:membrane protein DedA with SNARE-associated domain